MATFGIYCFPNLLLNLNQLTVTWDNTSKTSTNSMSKTAEPSIDTWGTIGNLTKEQDDALEEFTSKAAESDLDIAKFRVETRQSVSLRFLRARHFSTGKALTLLKECVQKKMNANLQQLSLLTADQAAKCDVESLKKFYPHLQLGYDKFNRPILFERSGKININAGMQMTSLENLINYHWWTMENQLNDMFETAAGNGPVVVSTCAIIDMAGLNMSHVSPKMMDHVKALIAIDNTCYPEVLGKMFVIHTPWLAGRE